MLLRMAGVGGGTTKRGRLSLLVGAVCRMVQGCHTPRDLMLSVVEMSVEFVISTSTCANSLSLVRMALFTVSKATEGDAKARVKIPSETLMGLYWMLRGLWGCNLKPTGGDGRAWDTGRKWTVLVWVPFGSLLCGPLGLLGPYVFIWCHLPGTGGGGFAYPHEARLLIMVY